MTKADKQKLLKTNSLYWFIAMILPAVFHFGFKAFASESATFPWPVLIPFLFLGLMYASNNMISQAIGQPTDDSAGAKK
jgi:Na+-driven multidrug efflux pump